jgi:long-chain acyl-CoA synthetase
VRELSVASKRPKTSQRNIADYVYDRATTTPDHVALRRRTGSGWQDITSAEFAREVASAAKGLIVAGIEPGDRVMIMSKTRYEWTLADMALFTVGAVVVPVYETSSRDQVEWILTDSGAKAAFVETEAHEQTMRAAQSTSASLTTVWRIDAGAIDELAAAGEQVADDELHARRNAVNLDDLASIIYTSGTTGRPKGCELTHDNFVSEVDELLEAIREFCNDATSTLLFLPIAHVFGRAIQIGCVASGCTLGHTADVKNLIADLGTFKPTFVLSVPRVFEKVYNTAKQRAHASGKGRIFDRAEQVAISYSQALDRGSVPVLLRAQHAVFDHLVYGKLRHALGGQCVAAVSGGAPLGERLGHFFRGLGLTIYEGYGLTETTAGVTVNRPGAIRIGTVGRPAGGVSVRVADDSELLFKARMVFRGYWRNQQATRDTFDAEGWFRTGDIGEIDDDGFVRITGRKKEMIVTASGKNVAPAILEDRVRAHWLVGQCLVVGDQRPFVAALVTIDPEAFEQWLAKTGRAPSTTVSDVLDDPELLAEIQAAIDEANKAVSTAESIRKFVVLPVDWTEASGYLTPSLKLKRNVVCAEFADQIAAMYAGSPAKSATPAASS